MTRGHRARYPPLDRAQTRIEGFETGGRTMTTILTRRRALALGGAGLLTMSACSKFYTYEGPAVTRVEVQKGPRRMLLMHHDQVLLNQRIQLGFSPYGHKERQGDGRTPEGRYHVDRRNPDSSFYLSVGIDYPNADDRAFARDLGVDPGGDIFIHGWGEERRGDRDWTAGCVACRNREMKVVYAMIRNGTPVDIMPKDAGTAAQEAAPEVAPRAVGRDAYDAAVEAALEAAR